MNRSNPLRIGALVVACSLTLGVVAPALAKQPIVASDMLRLRSVSSIEVATDGSVAVFAVRSIAERASEENHAHHQHPGQHYANRSHLFALDLFTLKAEPRQLTYGDRNDRAPVVSADGDTVAFVRRGEHANSEGVHVPQVWLMELAGGEARQVTSFEHGAGAPRWSPDGKTLVVESEVPMSEMPGAPPWPMERPQREWGDAPHGRIPGVTLNPDGTREEIRAWLARNAASADPVVINRIDFQGERSLREEMTFAHLFAVDLHDANSTPQQITSGFFDHNSARFLKDGTRVVYVATKPLNEHIDRVLDSGLYIVGIDGTNDAPLLAQPGWSFHSPRISPDGTAVAFVGQLQDEPTFRQERLGLVPLSSGAAPDPVWLTSPQTFDYPVYDVQWLPARSTLLFNCPREGGFPLMAISDGLIEPAPLVDFDESSGSKMPLGVHLFAAGGGSVVYTVTSPQNPCVLHVSDGRGDRVVYDLNPWVADRTLSMPRSHMISRPDGTQVEAWIMEPTDRVEGQTYPLCLQIHGGPHVMWGPGEDSMWHEFQLLCSWGYGVVYANPRGSAGYGYDFQHGNFQNWGSGPAGDVLAAVDRARLEDWVDNTRLVMTGGSYAGYLTAWIVGNDHRFKAAVAQRGVYDLSTFFGEGNAWQLVPWAMGGYPWESRTRSVLQRENPITYVNRIRTPLLIIHASNDLRTGVSQSEMLYRSLKALHQPVEYIRYPGAGHDLSRTGDPTQRLDRLNRIVEFFERHITNRREAPQHRETVPPTEDTARTEIPAGDPAGS